MELHIRNTAAANPISLLMTSLLTLKIILEKPPPDACPARVPGGAPMSLFAAALNRRQDSEFRAERPAEAVAPVDGRVTVPHDPAHVAERARRHQDGVEGLLPFGSRRNDPDQNPLDGVAGLVCKREDPAPGVRGRRVGRAEVAEERCASEETHR